MLVQLNAATRPGEDAVALLLDCHERIRRFSAMALKLAEARNVEAELIRDAAARVHRYFAVALPLHVEDEEQSIRARLDSVASEALRATLQTMSADHVRIDSLLEELLPIWDELQRDPMCLLQHRERLAKGTHTFEELMSAHLEMEETLLFPSLRQVLSSEALEDVRREMQSRRQPPQASTAR
jgi:hemerythrin-like domain-containing protein